MTRRRDPEAIYLANRAAVFRKLTRTQVIDELEAEHLIARWERQAEPLGLDRYSSAFWDQAEAWIAEQRPGR